MEGGGGAGGEAAELADYIAKMAGELAELAAGAKLEMVAYFLAMAQAESASIAQRNKAASGDP